MKHNEHYELRISKQSITTFLALALSQLNQRAKATDKKVMDGKIALDLSYSTNSS